MNLFADIVLSTEALVLIGGVISALTAAIALLFTRLITSKDELIRSTVDQFEKQLKSMEDEKDSYKEMFSEAIVSMETMDNNKRKLSGKALVKPLAAIVPEHSSPVTTEQQNVANLQTARARLTAVVLELGLPVRESAPKETDEQRLFRLNDKG